jgi:GrpB-like predicted nucleotidyltransferase (UPF0157 family)
VLAAIGELCPDADVREVGSTAIEGLPGKGDLDVLVRAPRSSFDATRAALDEVFPRDEQQFSSDIYQGYRVPSELDVAIQLTVTGGPHDDFVAFLELLRADATLLAAYADLKRDWNGRSMADYRAAKRAFIEAALASR